MSAGADDRSVPPAPSAATASIAAGSPLGPISIADVPPFGSPDAFTWEPLRGGVDAAWIYGKDSVGPRAALLRYPPGAVVSEHEHLGYEHIFVLAGSQSDGVRDYPAGTLTVFPPGWSHRITSTDGCVALAIWTGPLVFREG